MRVVALVVVFAVLGASVALAAVDPYAMYSPDAMYAYGTVSGQVSPDRVLACRSIEGIARAAEYLPYTADASYAPWCVCEQISPDRVLAVRAACGMCTF